MRVTPRRSTAPGLGVCEWSPGGLKDKSVSLIPNTDKILKFVKKNELIELHLADTQAWRCRRPWLHSVLWVLIVILVRLLAAELLLLSHYLCGMILETLCSILRDVRTHVLRAAPMALCYSESLASFFFVFYCPFFLWIGLWVLGLQTVKMSIILSLPCTANLS